MQNVLMADPQNYVHVYNTRSKHKSAQSFKDVDGAIIANSPVYTASTPFVTPDVKSLFMTSTPAESYTTQTAALGFLMSVVSSLFTTPKTKDPITTAATDFVETAPTPSSVSATIHSGNTPSTLGTISTPTTLSISATVGNIPSASGTVLTPIT